MVTTSVCIIMPVFNNENYIRQALNSILQQDFHYWKCWIVDDCSTDNSRTIAEEYATHDSRFRVLSTGKQSGPAQARNIGLANADSKYICFLDSDDYWCPHKLSYQLTFITSKKCAICYSGYNRINQHGDFLRYQNAPMHTNYQQLLCNNVIFIGTIMLNTNILNDIKFPETMGHEDLALWLTLLKQVPLAYGIDEPLATYREHQLSRNIGTFRRIRKQWEIYVDFEKISIWRASFMMMLYLYHGLRKRLHS